MPPLAAYKDDDAELPPSGAARAAILLLALGPSGASRLLKHLSPDEIKLLTRSAAALDSISRQQIDYLVSDFHEAFKSGPGLSGPARQMNELLQSALSEEEFAAIVGEEGETEAGDVPSPTIWTELEALQADILAAMLAREHPQIVAVLLAKVSAETASAIAVELDVPFRNEVMRRMLSLKPLAEQIELLIEGHIRQVYLGRSERPERSGSHAVLADIVNRMQKEHSELLIESIRHTQPKDAEALQSLLFAFEDVPLLPHKSRLILFDVVDSETVTLALRGAAPAIRECVLSALGARSRRMIESELGQDVGVSPEQVEAARRTISATALRMSGEGKLQLRAPAET